MTQLSFVSFAALLSASLVACSSGKDAASTSASASATTAPAKTSSRATASAASAAPTNSGSIGGVCSLVGSWAGNYPAGPYPFSGSPLEATFNADGTGKTTSARTAGHDNEFAWELSGTHLSFHGTADQPAGGRYSCRKAEEGKYTFTFSSDCSTATAKLESDPCKGRAITMDGLTVKRK